MTASIRTEASSDMAQSWIDCTVNDIAAPISNAVVGGPFGSNLVSRDYVPLGVPVIRGENMGHGRWVAGEFAYVTREKAAHLSANIARPWDIVFTQRGTLGQVAIVPPRPFDFYVVSQSQMKLTVDTTKADAFYLYYLFQTREQQEFIRRGAIQTGVPHTNLAHLRRTPLRLPSLDQQRAAAQLLGAFDDKIELNRRMNETLEAMARVFFRSQLTNAHAWTHVQLGDAVAINAREVGQGFAHEFIEYVDISSVSRGALLGTKQHRLATAPGRARRLVAHGDTIWSMVRPNRKSYLFVDWPPQNLVVSTGFAVLTPRSVSPHFLYFWVTRDEFVEYLTDRADGSAYPAVRPDDFARASILIPPPEVLEAFERLVAPLWERRAANTKESGTLKALRDALLPRLLSGEIRVRTADRQAVAVVQP